MSTPPGGGPPHDEGGQGEWGAPPPDPDQPGGQEQWGSPPPPPDAGQTGGPGWGQPGQWDQPAQQPGWGQQQPGWGQQQPSWDQQQQWGAPGPGYGTPQTSGLAIGALVSSILGFFCGIGFIIGLILGYSARNQIRSSGGRQSGEGIAMAAIVIGWIGVALMIVGFVIFFLVLGATMPASF